MLKGQYKIIFINQLTHKLIIIYEEVHCIFILFLCNYIEK